MVYAASFLLGALLLAAQAPAISLDFEYYRTRVEPIFLKPREPLGPGGTCFLCHTHVTSRFRLQQPAPGSLKWTEQQSRRNFEAVSRLVTPGDPLKSRLLLHPLAADSGGDPVHVGGKHWASQSDPEWMTIADWIRSAAPRANAEAPAKVDFEIFKTRVQPMFLAKRQGHARCYACHGQGTGFRLQTLSAGSTTWNEEQSRLNYEAIQRLVVAGDPESSRLLMVPLEEEAGGDPFHPGGKHWKSRNDPEWQALATWIRGTR